MDEPAVAPLLDRLVARRYGKPFVRNVLRGELVERMVLDTLGSEWADGGDYEPWDVRHVPSGTCIQVKQSAARQSWAGEDDKPSRCRFSIARRHGFSVEGARWTNRSRDAPISTSSPGIRRHTPVQIIVKCYVVKTADLPGTSSIALGAIWASAAETAYRELASTVERLLR